MKKKLRFCLKLVLLLIFHPSYAQEGLHQGQLTSPVPENFFSASPDVMSFQKHNIVPTNLYTGKVDVSIPIFEIKTGDISVPISISYNTGGIKVDDIASSVGLGWNLNAGGNIIRTVKDMPDNNVSYSAWVESDWDLGIFIKPSFDGAGYNRKGAMYYQNHITWGPENRHATYVESPTEVALNSFSTPSYGPVNNDISPDIFHVSAPGLNSSFITVNSSSFDIYPDNNNAFKTFFLDNNGAKMDNVIVDRRDIDGNSNFPSLTTDHSHYNRKFHPIKDFFEFNMTSNTGIKYEFSEEEVSETFYAPLGNQFPPDYYEGNNARVTIMSNNYSKSIHTWNLSQITDPLNNRTVNFEYETYGNNYLSPSSFCNAETYVTSQELNSTRCFYGIDALQRHYFGSFVSMESQPKRKRISKIDFTGGEVNFIYNHSRQDYPGEKALTEIIVTNYNHDIVKRVRFTYTYWSSKENCSQPECKRLILLSFDILSNDGTKILGSYDFDYNQTNKLPKRGSLQQDYLGYYNNNGVVSTSNSTSVVKPKLYFYQNQGRYSVLPFSRSDLSGQVIPGEINLIPNTYSLTGILKKITYPTGGSSEFTYENNTFEFYGVDYISGGARIKSQTIKDNGVVLKKVIYEYKQSNGKSSGTINNIPIYGYLMEFQRFPFIAKSFKVYDKPKTGIELTSGSYVGYSKITELEDNNGRTEYSYSSPKDYPNTQETREAVASNANNTIECGEVYLNNSAYPSIANVDYDYKRGKLLTKEVYNKDNILLVKEEQSYVDRIPSNLNIEKYLYIPSTHHDDIVNDPLSKHKLKITSILPVRGQFLIQNKKLTEYFNGTGTKITQENFKYNTVYPFVNEYKKYDGNTEIKINSYFPFQDEVNSLPNIQQLVSDNRISKIVKEKIYKDSDLINTRLTNYAVFGSKVLSKSLSEAKGDFQLEEDAIIDKRDSYGNILQYHNKANVYTSIVWGYPGSTLPIAKIDNLQYSQIPLSPLNSMLFASVNNPGSMSQHIDLFRESLPDDTMVTTYLYKPLIGIISIKDNRGYETKYEYDQFNELVRIKDAEGNIVKEYEYNYQSGN